VILVCGEALIDLVPTATDAYEARPGGGPLNIAVGLGRLGLDVALIARLAADRFGHRLRTHLEASRVRLDLAVPSTAPTTLAVLGLDAAGIAAYDFYIDGCADGGWRAEELPVTLPPGGALHVSGSLALPVPSMGDALEALLLRERDHRVIAVDPNIRPSLIRDETDVRARLRRWFTLADIVKASAEDVAWLAPGRPLEVTAAEWRGLGPAVVVITRGADGTYALGPAGPVDLPGVPVEVVDTVGAGDAFMSGLLAALDLAGSLTRPALAELSRDDLVAALGYAQQAAAITCGRLGADPPWRTELEYPYGPR
jgi:fructokinase